ncbi:cupredoxin domain-containing protein [Candidatus Micrarchaeota archaeon]|nr:cupredoxin domain-containing protein [Candidatus Micrarchaeota archaeon]
MESRNLFVLVLVAALLFAGCTGTQPKQKIVVEEEKVEKPVEEKVVETPIAETSEGVPKETKEETPPALPVETEAGPKVIEVTAKQWEFQPNPIKVKQGEVVTLKIKSIDVKHGFWVPDMGIEKQLNPGEEIEVKLDTSKKGTFKMICSFQCGAGHPSMKGEIIVE